MREKEMKITKRSGGILFLLTVTSLLGCIEEKSEYTINPNGSGKVTVDLTSTLPDDAFIAKGATPEDQIKPVIESILTYSKGIDTWKDISFELTAEGAIHFAGTAYFPDINLLSLNGGALEAMKLKLQFSPDPSGRMVLELTGDPDLGSNDKEPKTTVFSEAELAEQVKLAKLQYNQAKPMMTMMLSGLKHNLLVHLPAKIEKISNFQTINDTTIQWQLDGSKILEKIDQTNTDDEWLKQQIRESQIPITDSLGDSFFNDIIFNQNGPVQVVLSKESKNLFDYNIEVKAAKESYDKMLKQLGLCQTQTPPAPIEVPSISTVTEEPGTVKVGGVQLVRHTDEKRGIRPLNCSNSYTLSLILELPEPNLPITQGQVKKALTDTNESLLWRREITFPELSKDGKAVVFEVDLSLPGKEVKGLTELSGTLAYLKSSGTKKIDLGVMNFKEGAKSKVQGFSIGSIRPDWREGYTLMELNVDLHRGTLKTVHFYREDGTEIEVSAGGESFSRDDLLDVGYKTKGDFPPRGRIVLEVLDNPMKHEIHFELKNISLTGEPRSDID